jgi:hypothetical protein
MIRRHLALALLLVASCTPGFEDKTPNNPVDLTKTVRAQFDPANPIPVLRIIPSPTGLAQKPMTGELDLTKVAPAPCELPSTKQCLQFVRGWPASTPITIYFSGELTESTLEQGIQLLEIVPGMAPKPVMLDATSFMISPRPQPPAACAMGNNGSNPAKTYNPMDPTMVPPGIQVVITPKTALKPKTSYVLLMISTDMGGLRSRAGDKVESSALFSLMNVPKEQAPVESMMPFMIKNALLRSQVEDQILRDVFGGKASTALSDDERAMFQAALQGAGKDLNDLYGFFNSIIDPLVMAGAVKRSDLVLVNGWSTGPADPPVIEFDPANSKVPFPNDQLLTVTSTGALGGLRVSLPIDPAASETTKALIAGINTLNGFSTTAPIAMTTTVDVDELSVDPTPLTPCLPDECAIAMYPLNAQNMPDAMHPVPLVVRTSSKSALAPASIAIIPAIPLLENTDYVVAVKKGIKDVSGQELAAAQTFDLLKIPAPFVDTAGKVLDTQIPGTAGTFEQALECSTVPTTGMLATATEVLGNAMALENLVNHQRWLTAFTALENLPVPIPRTNILMAFTYKTQSITHDLDQIKYGLLFKDPATCMPGCWEQLLGPGVPRVEGPLVTLHGTQQIAGASGVVQNLCLGICEMGALAPAIPPNMCTDAQGKATAAVAGSALCQTAVQIVAGHLKDARLYNLKGYAAENGGPFQTRPGKAGTFTVATVARPRVIDIPMWVVTGTGTPSMNGYPIAIFQHGLGSLKEAGFYIANTFSEVGHATDPAGWATVMIDLPFHGARTSDLVHNDTGVPCDVDPADVVCTATVAGGAVVCKDKNTNMAPCDGLQDASGTGFLGVNLFATRDNFRQGTIDQLTLVRALQEESKPGRPLDDLDGTRIGYAGQSLGGITGGNLAAYLTPAEVKAVVLNVPGGGLVQNVLLHTVPQIAGPLYAGLKQVGICEYKVDGHPEQGCKGTAAFKQFLIIGEWILDPGDPLANSIGVKDDLPARMPLTPAKILMQMSLPDPVVPNVSAFALAAAYGFKIDGSDPHFQIYDFRMHPQSMQGTGCHPFLLAPVCGHCAPTANVGAAIQDNLCQSLGAQHQAADFIASGGATIDSQPSAAMPKNFEGFMCTNMCQ